MSKPRLLDLFCGAGGAAMGYARAGFEVVGVDIKPQPNYPFEFHQADALTVLEHMNFLDQYKRDDFRVVCFGFDYEGAFHAIHASPPCQAYTSIRRLGKGAGAGAPDLIPETREMLQETGLPYVIENVEGARSELKRWAMLCGSMFDPPLRVRRHRYFETNWGFVHDLRCRHRLQGLAVAVYGDHPQKTDRSPWRAETVEEGRAAMGMDWADWPELTQAIPPVFAEHIGTALLAHVKAKVAA